jgi:hypothetical protein
MEMVTIMNDKCKMKTFISHSVHFSKSINWMEGGSKHIYKKGRENIMK